MHHTLLVQTTEGIDDPEEFMALQFTVTRVSELLFGVLATNQNVVQKIGKMNCHIIAESYRKAFIDFHLERRSGCFGLPIVDSGSGISWQQHSWLVPNCAPSWVLDMAPCNGALMPLLICSAIQPWNALYIPDEKNQNIILRESDELARVKLTELLQQLSREYISS